MVLTAENVYTALATQASYFSKGIEKPKASRVDGLHGSKDQVSCWLAATQTRGILNVVQHQRCSVEKIDGLGNNGSLLRRHLVPDVKCDDGLVTDAFPGKRIDIARWRFENLDVHS